MISGNNTWLLFSLCAAIFWGMSYALTERLVKSDLTPVFVMSFTGILYMIGATIVAVSSGAWKSGMANITTDPALLTKLILVSVLHILGAGFILYAIAMKNATVVSLVEITYPFFVCLFAFLFYREVQVNVWTAIGGLLIFLGITMIYLKA